MKIMCYKSKNIVRKEIGKMLDSVGIQISFLDRHIPNVSEYLNLFKATSVLDCITIYITKNKMIIIQNIDNTLQIFF